MGGSEEFLSETYERLIWMAQEKGMITESAREILEAQPHYSLQQLEQCYSDLLSAIKNQAYYKLLERIENGYAAIEAETNDLKRKKYQDVLTGLVAEMDKLRPEEHRAVHDESA